MTSPSASDDDAQVGKHGDDREAQRLRTELAQLRDSLGGQGSGPLDAAESAAILTSIEETEALLRALEG